MKRHYLVFAAALLTLFCCLLLHKQGTADQAGVDKSMGRYYEPVEVPGHLIGDLTGTPLRNMGVLSYDGESWTTVLSQIDEVAEDGSFVLPHGPESNAEKGNGQLDSQDLIVFMARDSGKKAPDKVMPAGAEKVVPVEIIDPLTKDTSWVYVASFPEEAPLSKQEPYARLVDEKNYNVRFSTYGYDGLTNEREKEAIPTIFINKFWVLPEAGGNGENIIDRQKIRGAITFLGGMIKVGINEKIVSGGLVAYKPGPVRILSHSRMYPLFPMGIKGPKFYIDSIMVDTLTLTTTSVNIPFDPGSLITDMTLIFMTDLSPAAKGMYYYNSENREGFLINGKMDDKEKGFNESKDFWRLVTGSQGTQIQYTIFDPKFMTDGTATSTYNDDDEGNPSPPENFPGDIGAAADRINIRSLPAGSYTIKTFGCVPYDFYDPNGLDLEFLEGILSISRSPLQIRVDKKTIQNQGGMIRPIIKK